MEGILTIEDYKIHCVIGAHAYEREIEQEIHVDITLSVDITESAQTDSIVDTIDYNTVVSVCRDLAKTRSYHLIETFAFEAIHALKERFDPKWVKIKVSKKKAIDLSKSVSIELEL